MVSKRENLFSLLQKAKKQLLAIDLGPSLESLADATFDLLKMQDWFDSILVIDDSTASDILSSRLRFVYQKHNKQKDESTTAVLDDPRSDSHAHSFTSRNRLQVIKISKSLSDKEVRIPNTTPGIVICA